MCACKGDDSIKPHHRASFIDIGGFKVLRILSGLCTAKKQSIIIRDGHFIGASQYLSQPVATRLAAMAGAFKNDSPIHLIHIDDDDTVGCERSSDVSVVDGLHQQHANKNKYLSVKKRWCQRASMKIHIFGLVRVIKFQFVSRYSLFLVVQVYSKLFASAFGIAFVNICLWKTIYSLWEYCTTVYSSSVYEGL